MGSVQGDFRVGILDEAQPGIRAKLPGQMNVTVDQPRQHKLILEVDEPGAGRRIDKARSNGLDLAVGDPHALAALQSFARRREQAAGMDDRLVGLHRSRRPFLRKPNERQTQRSGPLQVG